MMRRFFLTIALAGMILLTQAAPASAHWWCGGCGGSVSYGYSGSYYGGYSYAPTSYGYYPSYYGGYYPYAWGIQASPYANHVYTQYGNPWSWGYYTPGWTGWAPHTTTRTVTHASVSTTAAVITVHVPTDDAQLWVDGVLMNTKGTHREFTTPALDATGTYSYTLKARWVAEGQNMERTIQVNARAGETVAADFRTPGREVLPAPTKVINK